MAGTELCYGDFDGPCTLATRPDGPGSACEPRDGHYRRDAAAKTVRACAAPLIAAPRLIFGRRDSEYSLTIFLPPPKKETDARHSDKGELSALFHASLQI